jgi:hypothetical protein
MATKKTAKATGKPAAFEASVRELAGMLARYAPTRMAKVSGAKSLAKLEALVTVPPELRALWSWADGCPGLLVMFADDLGRALDLFSVDDAVKTIEINRDAADFPEDLIPFAGESGSGDCFAIDGKGRVVYWDHEEGEASPHAKSLAVVLASTLKSIQKEALFGGPERKAGEVDKKALRLEKSIDADLHDAASVSTAFHSPAHKIREAIGKLKSEADQHRLYLRLRDRLRELGADAALVHAVEESIFYTATATRSWEDALASLRATGGVVAGRDNWNVLGLEALEAGELEVALRAFAGGASTESRLGEVAVARKLGREPSRALDAVAKEVAANVDAVRRKLPAKPTQFQLLDLVGALVQRATVEKLGGDAKAAAASLQEAYGHPLGERFRDPVEADAIARLAGLEPRK